MFAYCNNNPVNAVDYSGRDAVILYDDFLVGHIGLLFQDNNGTWWHFYWGTENDFSRVKCVFGANVKAKTWCVEYTLDIDLNSINKSNQYSGDYDDMIYLKGDYSSCLDETKNSNEEYNLYTNNCSQKSMNVLKNAEPTSSQLYGVLEEAAEKIVPQKAFLHVSYSYHPRKEDGVKISDYGLNKNYVVAM